MTNQRPNPYVGPRSFDEKNKLYGRDNELLLLTAQLISERVVLLHSPSGAGKTSLIRAGLVPILRDEQHFHVLPIARVNLEPDPDIAQTEGFNRYTYSAIVSMEDNLPEDPEQRKQHLASLAGLTLDAYLKQRPRSQGAPASELLIFDQFEEVLTSDPTDQAGKPRAATAAPEATAASAASDAQVEQSPVAGQGEAQSTPPAAIAAPAATAASAPAQWLPSKAGKEAFFAQLAEALRGKNRWALFAMREDYIGAVAPYARPLPNRFEVRFRLDLLRKEAAQDAILLPMADQYPDVVFDENSAKKLIDDLRSVKVQQADRNFTEVKGEYIEPVQLQVVCYNLWQSLDSDDRLINDEDLKAVGDVDKSLADYYAATVASVAEKAEVKERKLREWFNEKLITKEGIRGLVLRGPQVSEGLEDGAVALLENAHIIRSEARGGATWLELSHDRLIQPVRDNNDAWFNTHLTRGQRRASAWVKQERSRDLLLREKDLAQFEKECAELELTNEESEFLKSCRDLRKETRLRRGLMIGLSALFLLTVLALFVSVWAYNQSTARSVVTQGRAALNENNPQLAVVLALNAQQIADIRDASDLLHEATNRVDMLGGTVLIDRTRAGVPVSSVAWSAQGDLASGHSDGSITVWNLDTRRAQVIYKANMPDSSITSLAWSADGKLASGATDGTVIVWEKDKAGKPLLGHTSAVTSLAWSVDGKLASGSADSSVIVWDLETSQPAFAPLQAHEEAVTSLAWSADGRLASGSVDQKVIVWDLQSGQPAITPLEGHGNRVDSLVWLPDGRLASGSDSSIILWDLATGKAAKELSEHSEPVFQLLISKEGRLVSLSKDRLMVTWDLQNDEPASKRQGFSINSTVASAAPDGRVASGSSDGLVTVWTEKSEAANINLQKNTSRINSIAWSVDGRLASASVDKTVTIWDPRTGEEQTTLKGHSKAVRSVAWSADGVLASGADDGKVILWDVTNEKIAKTLEAGGAPVLSVAWSADGRLASGAKDGSVTLWDTASGKPLKTFKEHTGAVTSVAWSKDGSLASGSQDAKVLVWDGQNDSPPNPVDCGYSGLGPVDSLAWSPDGRLAIGIVSSSSTFVNTFKTYKTLIWTPGSSSCDPDFKEGHSDIINSVAWSPKNQLASASNDKTMIVWDMAKNKPLFVQKRAAATSVGWSQDGRVAFAATDGSITVLSPAFASAPCTWVMRNLTLYEWLAQIDPLYTYHPACAGVEQEVIKSPSLGEWFGWLGTMTFGMGNTFNDFNQMPNRFLWLTWPGRVLGILLAVPYLLYGLWLFRFLRKRPGMVAAVVIASIVLIFMGLMQFFMLGLLGAFSYFIFHVYLLVTFITWREKKRKILLAAAFVLSDLPLLVLSFLVLSFREVYYSPSYSEQLGLVFILFALSGAVQVLWLLTWLVGDWFRGLFGRKAPRLARVK